jgi:hypothetical protein
MAQRLYGALRDGQTPGYEFIERVLRETQEMIAPAIQTGQRQAFEEQIRLATGELAALVPLQHTFILVDEGRWNTAGTFAGRQHVRFLERDGHSWGKPADDQTAIRELERLRHAGAGFVVFGWPAFWWLDYYAGLHRHLRTQFRCVLENDRLVVFDLRS